MIRIAICDDDEKVCCKIEEYILEYGKNEMIEYVVERFNNSKDLIDSMGAKEVQREEYDILFLDIMLNDEVGSDIANKIRNEMNNNTVSIVFISSFTEYAMNLFSSRPLDFLVKPISYDKIENVLNIYNKIEHIDKGIFEIKGKKGITNVNIPEIIYITSEQRKAILITENNRYECYMKLSDINLGEGFIQIHKSFIINTRYIKEYRYDEVVLQNDIILPISKAYRKTVREMYQRRMRG